MPQASWGLSNSLSPISNVTIWTVMVVTLSSGLKVSWAIRPAAITTIMVSPIARLTASRTPPTIPGIAAGNSTFIIVSPRVAPSARDPSRRLRGTADSASSAKDEMNGINMIAMTLPAASAVLGDSDRPSSAPVCRKKRGHRQNGEEAVDDGRNTREDFKHGFDDVAGAEARRIR